MIDIATLRTEYSTLHAAAETLVKKGIDDKRDLTADEKVESDKQFARLSEIKATLDRHAKLAEFAFNDKDKNPEKVIVPTVTTEQAADIQVRDRFTKADLKTPEGRQWFNKHAANWARTGELDRQFATITGSTQSGVLMPVEVMPPIAPSAMNPFREGLNAYGMDAWKTTSTADINLPVFVSAAGSVVDPTDTSEVEQEPGLGDSVNSIVSTYHSGNVWLENRLLSAVDFDLLAACVPAAKYSKELAFESAIVTAISGNGSVSTVPTATTSTITYSNMVTFNRALPRRYQNAKVIVVGKQVFAALENLQTTTNYPVLNQDAQNSTLKRFNGTPVLYSEYFSNFGANNVVGCVFSLVGARLRDAGEGDILQRFTQTANRQGQTGFDLYGYHSFAYAPNSMQLLVCPAS